MDLARRLDPRDGAGMLLRERSPLWNGAAPQFASRSTRERTLRYLWWRGQARLRAGMPAVHASLCVGHAVDRSPVRPLQVRRRGRDSGRGYLLRTAVRSRPLSFGSDPPCIRIPSAARLRGASGAKTRRRNGLAASVVSTTASTAHRGERRERPPDSGSESTSAIHTPAASPARYPSGADSISIGKLLFNRLVLFNRQALFSRPVQLNRQALPTPAMSSTPSCLPAALKRRRKLSVLHQKPRRLALRRPSGGLGAALSAFATQLFPGDCGVAGRPGGSATGLIRSLIRYQEAGSERTSL